MLTQDDKQVLRELIEPKAVDPIPMSADSPSRRADLQCASCNAFVTIDGAQIRSSDFAFVCEPCAQAAAKPRRTPVRLLKKPAFYVALLTLWAVILWFTGWGNNSVATTARGDSAREWFDRRYPSNLVLQLARATVRAEYLDAHGETKQAGRWHELARTAAITAADEWSDTPAEPVMRFIAATALWRAGDPKAAYREMTPLSKALGTGDEGAAYRYARGLCALDAGQIDDARDLLDPFLAVNDGGSINTERLFGKMVDQMIERAEKGADPAVELVRRLRTVAGLETSRREMTAAIVRAYLDHGVEHPELEHWIRLTGAKAPQAIATDGKRGTAGFQEVEDDD